MSYHLLNTDGGMVSSGRREHDDPPGEAAVAVVLSQIKNGKERVQDAWACAIGPASNDVAEYRAVIEGLRFALSEEVKSVRVFMDSEFVVDQLNDRAKVGQDDLRDLNHEARELLDRFTSYRVSWVPRERNQLADALVRSIIHDA